MQRHLDRSRAVSSRGAVERPPHFRFAVAFLVVIPEEPALSEVEWGICFSFHPTKPLLPHPPGRNSPPPSQLLCSPLRRLILMARSARIRNPRLFRLQRSNKPERMRAHKIVLDRLLDLRHMARHARAPRAPLGMVRMFAHRPPKPRRILLRLGMAPQAKRIPRSNQIRRILSAVHLVAIEAPHLPVIHIALHKIIPLHPVLMRGHIFGILQKVRSPRLQILQPPVIDQPVTRQIAHRPNRRTSPQSDCPWTPLAVALNTTSLPRTKSSSPDSQCSRLRGRAM